jgi:NAD(P)-dependent dehydrogenase (short-subunit alcohol dehydrogenase family)
MAGRVEGKVAMIVGAGCVGPGWGNGRAAAVLFAREGAKVFAVDKDGDAMKETVERIIPVMIAQGGGAIVNTASSSGIRYTGSPQIGYASSKAAVIQFSRVTAVQYASKGIRVNTVIPGQMHTPMVEVRLAKQRTGGDIEALLKSRVDRIPLGFMGDGRDTAHAVLFLASEEARFITGTEIVVDGGMTVRCD